MQRIGVRLFGCKSYFKGSESNKTLFSIVKNRPIHNISQKYLIPKGGQQLGDCSHSYYSCKINCRNRHFSHQNVKIENVINNKSECSTNSDAQAESHDQEDQSEKEFDLFENINYDEITGGDEESLDKFKLLMLEVDVLRQDGMGVPKTLTTEEWKELFSLQTKSQRMKFLTFLWKNEIKRQGEKRKRERKRLARLEKLTEVNENNDHIRYGFQGCTIFTRIYDSTINFYDNWKLVRAMMYGQNIILDCGFEDQMTNMEIRLSVKQLVYLFGENRLEMDPFNIHFCNFKKDGYLYQLMQKAIPTIEDASFPINIHEKHYLDLFPKEKLVYLTPHCRTELKEFNFDDIYIIGAIVDRVNSQPLTLAKAKSEGLRMAQLPLDRYLDWHLGTKSLTINQVLKILQVAKDTGDWNLALEHVPQRKVRRPDEELRDRRKPVKRGTTFQPPYNMKKYV